jgi:glycine/D-amino acid oxidase-like deaminating enzyme
MIGRRVFLNGALAGVGLAGASVSGAIASPPPAPRSRPGGPRSSSPDVVVVGAGAFGGWSALSLLEKGARVASIDAYGPSNPRAASAGETRSLRSGYGDAGFYSAWSLKALELWRRREIEFGRTLLYPNDRLELAQAWSPTMRAQREIFDRLGIHYEILDRAQLRRAYPQMSFDDVEFAFVEKESAVVLMARNSMIRASEVFQEKGGVFRTARALPGESRSGRLQTLRLNDGSTLTADQFVFAVGPWSPKVFPDLMGPRVEVARSEYYYWGVPAGDVRFSWPHQPAWHDHIEGGYGFGSIERGLKYSPPGGGRVLVDPDTTERLPTDHILARGRRYIGMRFPDMKEAPILETRVCQMESTADTHFVIDRHPGYDNVWLASGGGGHGFKFAPLIGDYVSDRVLGRDTDSDLDTLFSLAARPTA